MIQKIGHNLIDLVPASISLRKTSRFRVNRLFVSCIALLITVSVITYLSGMNIHRFHWPKDFFGQISLILLILSLSLWFVFLIRSVYIDYRVINISQNSEGIIVNGKAYGSASQIRLIIKKRVGWKGLTRWYNVQLKGTRGGTILSQGNLFEEAKGLVSIIAGHLAIKTS